MANFCQYCGKELVNNQCTCDDFVAHQQKSMETKEHLMNQAKTSPSENTDPNLDQKQVYPHENEASYVNQSSNQGFQQQNQGYQQQNQVNYQEIAKENFQASKNLFINFIKHPFSKMNSVFYDNSKAPYILGGLHYIIIVLLLTFMLPEVTFLGRTMADNFLSGLKSAIVLFLILTITGFIVLQISKRTNPSLQFTNVLKLLFLTTVPASIFYLVGAIIASFAPPLGIILFSLGNLSLLILLHEAIRICMNTSSDRSFWVALAIIGIEMLITYLLSFSYLQSYFSMW